MPDWVATTATASAAAMAALRPGDQRRPRAASRRTPWRTGRRRAPPAAARRDRAASRERGRVHSGRPPAVTVPVDRGAEGSRHGRSGLCYNGRRVGDVRADPAASRPPGAASPQAPSTLGVGVVVWLASELMFFAGLFAALLHAAFDQRPVAAGGRRARDRAHGRWPRSCWSPPAGRCTWPSPPPGATTGAAAVRWLGITGLMGAVFLGNQALEYAQADVPASTTTRTARSST